MLFYFLFFLRTIDLDSADGLPPLPLMLNWVREGILVVGMETEMRVYNQWNISTANQMACKFFCAKEDLFLKLIIFYAKRVFLARDVNYLKD